MAWTHLNIRMNFNINYSTFCNAFYLTVLGLTIPFYALFYHVTGFNYNPTKQEVAWIIVVVGAFIVALSYLTVKKRMGFKFDMLRILFSMTLLMTAYGCIRVSLVLIQVDAGKNVHFIISALFYSIPLAFVLSTVVIFVGLFLNKVK
jgi:hypothetical protein